MLYTIDGSPIELNLPASLVEGAFVFPTSFSQQRMWFLCQLASVHSLYTISQSILVAGDLDLKVLKRCFHEIVRRHEVLRTVFAEVDGEPVQVVLPTLHIDLPIISLDALAKKEWEWEVQRLATEEMLRPFDLAQGPLLRFSVLSHSRTQTYAFLFSIHHIIADSWSVAVFWQEIELLYKAYSANHLSPLPELPVQYADFTLWQRQVLESETGKKQLNYWKQQLQNIPPLLELPTDRPRPTSQTFLGAVHTFVLGSEETYALKALSRQEQSTLFMTLLTVFQIFLARYSGQLDFAVGTLIANRQQKVLEDLIGLFVNTLVLRATLSENIPFCEYLARVREVVLASYANSDLPFDKLIEELQPARNLSYNPLFQVMFVLQNAQETQRWGQLTETMTWKNLPIENPTAKFDLTLVMWEDADKLSGRWEYNKSLFEAATIQRLTEHFLQLLASAIAQPQQPVWELPILTEQEKQAEHFHTIWQSAEGGKLSPLSVQNSPLSFAQQRLWFLDQLQPNSSFYNISTALRIQGPLELKVLVRSFNEIVRRHEALRTTFQTIDGQASQVIKPLLYLSIPLVDLYNLPEEERDRLVFQLAEEEREQPFDLTNGPLLRLRVLRIARNIHILFISIHHIVSDGWSMGVLMRELTVLYRAFAQGKPSPLPELPVQYADFVAWQRQRLQGQVLENTLSYWKQRLRDFPPFLALPSDHPRPPIKTFQGATHFFTLPAELSESLRVLSRHEGVTLFMTLLATFQILLHRYTGQTDIVVGTPIANRSYTELEDLIGFLVNTLVLRIDLSGNPDVREVLRRVREMALGAYQHQDMPFEQLVEELHPVRDLSHEPLFEVVFSLQNDAWSPVKIGELTLDPLEIENRSAKFDLSLTFGDNGLILIGGFEYNTSLFEAATIARMADHLQQLLEKIVTSPDTSLSNLPLLTVAESQQMLVDWNNTRVIYATDMCLHLLFEAQVERTPAAVALIFEDEQIVYRELNERANKLAHFLQQEGVGPEALVGLCVERSIEAVVGLLAILKAGGAYVPLDSSHPPERLAFMLLDCQASFLLTQSHLRDRLPVRGVRLLCLDTDAALFSQQRVSNLPCTVQPDQLAYVMYTSGSTGHPKGVLGTHASICNRLLWGRYDINLQSSDRTLQIASLSFDISIWELFSSLLVGGSVVLACHEGYQERDYLTSLISRQHITVIHVVPSLLRILLEEPALASCTSLRYLLCGGELLPADLARCFQARLPIEIHHLYGPTEAAISSTSWTCPPGITVDVFPIGRPIANTSVFLLDRSGQPVPVNVPGELYIGGACVVRGYLRQPDLTAERFIPHPFSSEAGTRLYNTGDLARYRSNGDIEFLGRNDQQIKIRGARVEPGEIETILTQHATIRQAIVLAREFMQNEKRLVAYFVPSENASPTSSELRNYLKARLPDYIVPSHFIKLEELPLNANGKIDQRLLPSSDRATSDFQETYRAPRNSLELQFVQIFESVLGVRPIGITDNFFEFGGHSLLAVRLMALIQKATGQNLPLSVLFRGATIEHLVSTLRQRTEATQQFPLVAIQANGSKPPFFCVHPIGGEVFCYLGLSRLLGMDQPFYGLQALDFAENENGKISLEQLATHYIEAIQTVQPEGPYILSGWSFGALVAFEMARQMQQKKQKIALLALLDPPAPQSLNQQWDSNDASIVAMFARELEGRFGRNLSMRSEEELRHYTADELLDYVLRLAREVNIVPLDAGSSQVRHLLHIFKMNIGAMIDYVPQIYAGRITLFCANEVLAGSYQDTIIRWRGLSTEDIALHMLPGNHFTILKEPNIQELARELLTCLSSM